MTRLASSREPKPQLEPLPVDPVLQSRQAEQSEKTKQRLREFPANKRFFVTKQGLENRAKVLESLHAGPKRMRDIIADTGLPLVQAKYTLQRLQADGLIQVPGRGHLGFWEVVQG